ncbi:MAG: SDR family oxidoreductase [Deltaproteobacteria bacterium]|nr:SDR family oxidoreductase [Deltaproteobacteria bacterium]
MATVLVTGSNRGIGLALCRVFKERGDHVIATCRKSSADLEGMGVEIVADIDVTSDQAVAGLAQRLGERRIDVLVLNAGILRQDSAKLSPALDLETVQQQIAVNAIAPLRLARALVAHLHAGSKIALITSRMGSIADNTSGSYYGYRMSKAAMNAMGMSLARDLAARQIAVAILHPGYVSTDMTAHAGNVAPKDAARMLVARIDELTLATTGTFWHANGEQLPW